LVDINTADSASLVEVSGIGPVTARSIVRYRSLIFFFHSLGQLQEVWGVRPENLERMLPYLTVGDGFMAFPHLKINEMDAGQLGRHKYLGYKDARMLVAYREVHGSFADMDALRKVPAIDSSKWTKLEPYILF
jgi:DNA uptake protein ComE-like DNA-binding protein